MTQPTAKQSGETLAEPGFCSIVELRQYTLHPDKRDVLIELFDRAFIESQAAVGISIIGQFRDRDHPNRFVWLRGFRDMPSRAQALGDFYSGPVWKEHRDAANATMIDSDNVLLLRPAHPTSGFPRATSVRPAPGASAIPPGLMIATIYYFDAPVSAEAVDFFEHTVKPLLAESGAAVVAAFVTEESLNIFPALPLRTGEHALVWFARFRDQAAYEQHVATLARSQPWRDEIAAELLRRLKGAPEVLTLTPTARSQLHG